MLWKVFYSHRHLCRSTSLPSPKSLTDAKRTWRDVRKGGEIARANKHRRVSSFGFIALHSSILYVPTYTVSPSTKRQHRQFRLLARNVSLITNAANMHVILFVIVTVTATTASASVSCTQAAAAAAA
eukprot:3937415-Pyramimonas_sp.AAC.1